MATAIATRAGGPPAIIRLEIGRPSGSGLGVTEFTLESGQWPVEGSAGGEVIVKLFWHTVAGPTDAITVTTTDIATLALPFLLNPTTVGAQATNAPLAELPIHLIGHSRGGSVVAELSRLLAQNGVWVDQVTTLDPHPIVSDGVVNVYDNVLFADNYFQIDDSGFFPISGEHVDGAAEEVLTDLFDIDGINDFGNFSDHVEVHDWYHGTIDLAATTASGDPLPRSIWYPLPSPLTYARGFQLSRLTSGQWGRENTDLLRDYSGEGWKFHTNAVRSSAYTITGTPWPNIFLSNPGAVWSAEAGQRVPLEVRYRDAANLGYATVELAVDDDGNPYNNTSAQTFLAITNTATGNGDWLLSPEWKPRIEDDGKFVYARITERSGQMRYYYLPTAFHIRAPIAPSLRLLARTSSQGAELSLTGTVGQDYTLEVSTDLKAWSPFSSFTATNALTSIVDADASTIDRRFYRVVSP